MTFFAVFGLPRFPIGLHRLCIYSEAFKNELRQCIGRNIRIFKLLVDDLASLSIYRISSSKRNMASIVFFRHSRLPSFFACCNAAGCIFTCGSMCEFSSFRKCAQNAIWDVFPFAFIKSPDNFSSLGRQRALPCSEFWIIYVLTRFQFDPGQRKLLCEPWTIDKKRFYIAHDLHRLSSGSLMISETSTPKAAAIFPAVIGVQLPFFKIVLIFCLYKPDISASFFCVRPLTASDFSMYGTFKFNASTPFLWKNSTARNILSFGHSTVKNKILFLLIFCSS